MSAPIAIPSIVARRWREALARPSIGRWSSLAQMISDMVVNGALYNPGSPIVDDLRTLAHLAYAHQIGLEPEQIEEAA